MDPKIYTKNISPEEKLKFIENIESPPQKSDLWFKLREERLTASLVDSVIGNNPYQKPIEVLFKKTGYGKKFITVSLQTLFTASNSYVNGSSRIL